MEDMNNADREVLYINHQLELVAKLVEAKATTVQEAIEVILDCKVKA